MSPADSLVEACDRYLKGRKAQLWAHFSISTDEDRRKAAIWLAEQVQGVLVEKAVKVTTVHDLGLVGGAVSQNLWPTTNLCPDCEVYSVDTECWCCGGPMVRKAPRWNSVHVFHAERRSQAVAGRIVKFDPIDDLL